MRLATMNVEDWQAQAPFVDTLCLPVYELGFAQKQLDLARGREIERIAALVEKKLTGRLLLLPAICYVYDEMYLQQVMKYLKNAGFNYLVLLTDRTEIKLDDPSVSCFSVLANETSLTDEEIESRAERCFEQIVNLWMENT